MALVQERAHRSEGSEVLMEGGQKAGRVRKQEAYQASQRESGGNTNMEAGAWRMEGKGARGLRVVSHLMGATGQCIPTVYPPIFYITY